MKVNLFPRHIVLKATRTCNANCYHCRDRQARYERRRNVEADLSLSSARKVLEFGSTRGLKRVTISGGEPTLTRSISELVSLAAQYAKDITIITNGWNNQEPFWRRLVESGITHVDVSLDGHNAELHDWLRNRRGLFKRLSQLMDVLHTLQEEYSQLEYSVVTIVSNFNLNHLPILQRELFNWNVSRWILHYPECDQEALFSPSPEKQHRFRKETLPQMLDMFSKKFENDLLIAEAQQAITKLYDPLLLKPSLTSRGIYHQEIKDAKNCSVLGKSILVKYNGNIFACIGGDYTNDVVGQINEYVEEINLDNQAINRMIENGIDYCRFCPVPHTIRIPFK